MSEIRSASFLTNSPMRNYCLFTLNKSNCNYSAILKKYLSNE
ncbi:hypothetical protein BN133_1343 [Cronobacter dublinensis 582]|nr:hypothetical protein BN133_1343 [Cronobacter dublinensis 582]